MLQLVTGAIGFVMFSVFIGFYIYRVDAPPLWIVMIVCLLFAGYDIFVDNRRNSQQNDQ